MSHYDERHEALKGQLATVQERLAGLSPDRRESIQDELTRLEESLGFATVVIDRTDPELVADAAHNELSGALTQINDHVVDAEADPDPYTEAFLNAVSRLPAAKGEITAQAVKKTVANVKRSASRRLNALEKDVDAAKSTAEAVTESIEAARSEWNELAETKKAELAEQLEGRLAEFDQTLNELRTALDEERQRVESVTTEQAEQFRQSQDERADQFKERERALEEQIAALEDDLRKRTEALLGEIEQMKERSAELVGAIGITGTAGRYRSEADEQRQIADRLRLAAVASGVLAIAVAIWSTHEDNAKALAAKLAISVVLGGVARYLARQSARHRGREERARGLQLDLTAFPVFVEGLPEDARVQETVDMVKRSFVGAQPAPDHRGERGPAFLDGLLHRREKRDG